MDNLRNEKIEALQTAAEYSDKLQNGIKNVINELRGEYLPDTKEYLDTIIKGLNWEFQVYNRTNDIIAETSANIVKEDINAGSVKINDAIKVYDKSVIADTLEDVILPFLENIKLAASEVA